MSTPLQVFKVKQINYEELEKPKTSIVLCTFREKPKLELIYESLSHQTLKNFELVIADYLFDKRKDFVRSLSEKYHIPTVHVPRDKYGVKAFNVGIANSSGEYMIHINDANYFPYQFIEKHLQITMKNFLSLGTRYFTYKKDFPIEKHLTGYIEVPEVFDEKTSEEICKLTKGIKEYLYLNFGEHCVTSPQDFRLLGLPSNIITGDNLIMEAAPGWTYGGSIGGPTEMFLALGGFDERFDQGFGWSDCNLGVRAFNAGYKSFMNISNWCLEIQDEEHDHVFDFLPDYKTEEARKYNWKLYEEACEQKLTTVNPHMNLREIRNETLKGRTI